MSRMVSIIGMVAALASALALDRWVLELRKLGHSTLRLGPTLWGTAIAMLATVSLVLALGWYVAYQRRGSRMVGIVYLAIGLALLAFSPLAFAEPSPILGWMTTPALRAFKLTMLQSSGISLLQLTSAAITAIGLAVTLSGQGRRSGSPVPA